jgi:hypothetical protein
MSIKKTLIASCSALSILGIGSAFAGDSASYEPFSGGYLGIVLGAQSTDFENGYRTDLYDDDNGELCGNYNEGEPDTDNGYNCDVARDELGGSGAVYGLRAGLGKQYGTFYAGVDLMAAYAGYFKDTGYIGGGGELNHIETSVHAALTVTSLATAQARLGMVFDDFLVFGSAGVGYVDANMCTSTSESEGSMCSHSGNGDMDQDFSSFGAVVGAGVVWKPYENWSVGVNVDHIMLNNSQKYTHGSFDGADEHKFNQESELKSVTTGQMTVGFHF